MKRKEQIEVATAAYINGRLKNNVPPEEIEEIRLAYQAGFICADEHPDLYSVTRKAVEREREHLIDKACQWLEKNACDYEHSGGTCDSWFSASDLVESFRKYMEE